MGAQRIEFSNAQMFNYVMSREEICRSLLERVLKMDIERIDYISVEHEIDPNREGRGVRLDAYAKNSTTAFDVEMQSQDEYWLGLRFRYYQAAIDTDLLKKGDDYDDLPWCYIIFLCVHDPFQGGLPVYTLEPRCYENDEVDVNCRMRWIVLNGESWEREGDSAMRALLQYIEEGTVTASDSLVSMIDQVVSEANADEKVMSKMISVSTVEENAERRVRMAKRYYRQYYSEEGRRLGLEEGREAGREEGREEGLAEGRELGRELGLAEGLAEGREEGLAEGREEGLAEGRAEGRELGLAEGRAESEALYGRLVEALLTVGRQEDLLRATQDEAYRASLIDELGLQEPRC